MYCSMSLAHWCSVAVQVDQSCTPVNFCRRLLTVCLEQHLLYYSVQRQTDLRTAGA